MKENEYKYANLKMTTEIFVELLIQLFDGKQFERYEAIKAVGEYHGSHGGVVSSDMVSRFKSAVSYIRKNGICEIENPVNGTWRLKYKAASIAPPIVPVVEEVPDSTEEYKPDEVIGDGPAAVYAYYFDSYRKLAELEEKDKWPFKIGRTDGDPIRRVLDQTTTCHPEMPHLALVIRCQNSEALESALHSVLKLNGRWIDNAPGTEWFLTSIEEIKRAYNNLFFRDDNDQQLEAAG